MPDDQPQAVKREARLPYHPPAVEVLGSVAELTAGASSSGTADATTGYTPS